jgi:selenocysteine lyase/cysteine desulfurase
VKDPKLDVRRADRDLTDHGRGHVPFEHHGADEADREDRLEAGTPNIPGIAGLLAGVEFVFSEGVENLHERALRLKSRLRDGLGAIPGVRVLSPEAPEGGALVTIVADRVDPSTLGMRLQEEWSVLTRTGLHCAPEVHRLIGTLETGAVRFSLGWSSTEEDVDRAIEGVNAIIGTARPATKGVGVA